MRPTEVHRIYLDGVEAVRANAMAFSAESWSTPACGHWTATETVQHLVGVVGWYHQWLDRALAGETSRPFPGADIDDHTAAGLVGCSHLGGPEAVGVFVSSAADYLERARENWDHPFSYPFGTVTVGLHAGVAAAEWHLHAWDLSGVTGDRHVPAEPGKLLVAAGECVAAAEGGVRGAVTRRLLPIAARRAPWQTLLRRAGRG